MDGGPESTSHFSDFRTDRQRRRASLDPPIWASSRALGWDGVVVEQGVSSRFEGVQVAPSGHWLGINLDDPRVIETTDVDGLRPVIVGTGSFVILPAGSWFDLRSGPSAWGAVEVSLDKIRRVVGTDLRVVPMHGLSDEPLAAVVLALLHEAATGGAAGRSYRDALVLALVARLAGLFDVIATPADVFTGQHLAGTYALVDERLADRITVKSLARGTGLSPAHFSREFKRTTGETPHAFVMRRRLEHAHEFLADGGSIADAALCSGFADQAHLSRLFKRRYFVTPGAFRRARP
ncbi:MAG TPA: helix-turn-helix transcriptional regulator [Polyangia bacterium]|nr:helix-turn-helix transcriptional regulator [Polyangia bacterium]